MIAVECSVPVVEDLLDAYVGKNKYKITKKSNTCMEYSAYNDQLLIMACDMFAEELTPELIGGLVSFVWDRAALTALHPADHHRYIEKLQQLSMLDTHYLMGVYWHGQQPDQGPPFPISMQRMVELFPRYKVHKVEEMDAKNERWTGTSYKELLELCFLIKI